MSGHHLHIAGVGQTSGHPPGPRPRSQRQADTSVTNEEQVTCQRARFSRFVVNVIYVIGSAGSHCPPPTPHPSILFLSLRCNLQKSKKKNKDNVQQQTPPRCTHRI